MTTANPLDNMISCRIRFLLVEVDVLVEMPVNVTRYGAEFTILSNSRGDHSPVKEPGTRIISHEADSHVVCRIGACGYDIAPDRIDKISRVATRNSHNIKCVLRKGLVRDNEGTNGPHTP